MHHVMVRFRLKPDQVERNLKLLRDLYRDFESVRPGGLRYETLQLDDGLSFAQLHSSESGEFHRLPAFRRFRSTLLERRQEPLTMATLDQFGSFDSR